MELKGTIIEALPETSGTSKTGNPWKKREYMMEYVDGNYARKMAFTCFGENADRIVLNVGDKVVVSFDIESREWNGRYYTDIRCWRAVPDTEAQAAAAPQPAAQAGTMPPPPAMPAGDEEFPF